MVNFLLFSFYWKTFVNDVDEEAAAFYLTYEWILVQVNKRNFVVSKEVNHFHWLFLITRLSSLSFILDFPVFIHAHAKVKDKAVKISSIWLSSIPLFSSRKLLALWWLCKQVKVNDPNKYNESEKCSTSSFYYGKKKVSAIEEVENPQIVIGDKSRLKSWEKFNLNLNLINPQYQHSSPLRGGTARTESKTLVVNNATQVTQNSIICDLWPF